jgi:hypothetical protein
MKSLKKVVFTREGKPLVTLKVKGYNKILNAPRHKIHLGELGMKKQEWGC